MALFGKKKIANNDMVAYNGRAYSL